MKLAGRDAAAFVRKPDASRAAILIFGDDAMRVSDARMSVVSGLVGPQGEAEMRLARMASSDAAKDPAMVNDAIKAQGFFPGPRAVLVEGATDGHAQYLTATLADWRTGDATMVVTAGRLAAKSALRKLFEGDRNAVAIGIYDDPPGRDEIETMLKAAELPQIEAEAMAALLALARAIEPGDFRQTVEKLGLYMRGEVRHVTPADVAACAPASIEAEVDDMLAVVAEARRDQVGPLLRRLYAQGIQPVGICISATRHFRTLHAVASDPAGPSAGIGKLRPPVFGPRRDALQRQAGRWGTAKLEAALTLLLDTDLQLRSSDRAPQQALVERALIRICSLPSR